ncbi:MAG TPA: hypothetical protein VGK90_03420, partial [Rhizomicrobium sp.]
LDPGLSSAKKALADTAATLGRPEEAVSLVLQALKLDPLSSSSYADLAAYSMRLGRLGEAEAAIRKAIALLPNGAGRYATLSQIDILRGNADTALADAQREPAGLYHDEAIAQALQIGPDHTAANAALSNFIVKYQNDSPFQVAETYAVRKDGDKMFEWLERARVARDSLLQELLIDPFFLPWRHDPHFTRLCQELNLPVPKD